MNFADREACLQWFESDKVNDQGLLVELVLSAWQAALEWRDSQDRTSQINQQLVELLDKAAALLDQMMVLDQVDPQSAPEPVSAVDNDAWYLIGDIKAALAATQMRGDA